jgi:hypothetical protein
MLVNAGWGTGWKNAAHPMDRTANCYMGVWWFTLANGRGPHTRCGWSSRNVRFGPTDPLISCNKYLECLEATEMKFGIHLHSSHSLRCADNKAEILEEWNSFGNTSLYFLLLGWYTAKSVSTKFWSPSSQTPSYIPSAHHFVMVATPTTFLHVKMERVLQKIPPTRFHPVLC